MAKSGPKARTKTNSKPKPPAGSLWASPAPPADLTPEASAEFDRLVAALTTAGTLDRTDPQIVCLAARLSAMIAKASKELEASPMTLSAANGTSMPHPMISVVANLTTRLRGLMNDMGLTPKTSKPGDAKAAAPKSSKWSGLLNVAG